MGPSATLTPTETAFALSIQARAHPPRSRATIIDRPTLPARLDAALDRQVVSI